MLKRLLAVCAVMAATMSAFGQTADEIIEKNLKAMGGIEKLKALKSVRLEGRMTIGPIEAPFTMIKSRPSNMRLEFTIQGMTGTQAFDGTTGWTMMPFMGKKDPEKMPAEQLDLVKSEADFDGQLIDYKHKGTAIELAGKEDVNGTPAYKLKLTAKDGHTETIYFDASSFLRIKSESTRKVQGQELQTEETLGNYKEFGGILFAMSIEDKVKGQASGQAVIIEKVELNPTLAADTFTIPAPKKPAPAEEKPAEPKQN